MLHQPLSQTFLQIWKQAHTVVENTVHHVATPKSYFVLNPIDDRMVEIDYIPQPSIQSAKQMHKDIVHYSVYKNANLTLKMVSAVTIIVDMLADSGHQDTIKNMVHQAIRHCIDIAGKPLIFTRSQDREMLQSDTYIKENAHVYSLSDKLWDCIPRIAKKCIIISNAQKPMQPISLQPQSSVLYWCSHDPLPSQEYIAAIDQVVVPYTNTCKTEQVFHCMNLKEEWKHYITMSSPYKTLVSYQQHTLLYLDFMAQYYAKHKDAICACMERCKLRTGHTEHTEHVVVLVDNRENIYSVLAMQFSMLNTNWDGIIVTSEKSIAYYREHLPGVHVLHDPLLDVAKFDIDVYNEVLEQPLFWERLEHIGYKGHALIVQDDGMIVRPGINRLLQYDYVGAPWADDERNTYIKEHITSNLVGNGGLSLRCISIMKDICSRFRDNRFELFYFNLNRIPEDVFFVKHLAKIGAKIAPFHIACTFAAEQGINVSCLGMHKFWVYNSTHDVQKLFNAFLQ